jgi:protein TonB
MPLLSSANSRQYSIGSRKWYTLPVSIVAHAAGLAALFVVPLLATDVLLPSPERLVAYIAAASAPPVPPPPTAVMRPRVEVPADVSFDAAPVVAPDRVTRETQAPIVNLGTARSRDFSIDGFGGAVRMSAPPPSLAPAEPVRVGGTILTPRKIKGAAPIYPAAARAARLGGVVLVEAIIGRDGRVRDARVARSQPLFDLAALDAVRGWRYTPTLLNGEPVEVVLTVAVTFALNDAGGM